MMAYGISIVRLNADDPQPGKPPPRRAAAPGRDGRGRRVPAVFTATRPASGPGQAEQFLAQPGEPAGQQVVAGAYCATADSAACSPGCNTAGRPALGLRADEARHLRGERPRRGGRQEHPARR
jgi:hypothetical protein